MDENNIFTPRDGESKDIIEGISMGIMIAILVIASFNIYQMNQMPDMGTMMPNVNAAAVTNIPTGAAVSASNGPDVTPKGVPNIYGKELGISFDDVSAASPTKAENTINKLGAFDDKITLSGKDLERYISIAGKISCEYCCGAEAIIYKSGKAACGCAHSYAMRGLAKYLITNHPNEFTDDQILEELGKWKILFFPGPMAAKAKVLQSKGIELNYINLASNKYRGIEQEA